MRFVACAGALLLPAMAVAQVDPKCEGIEQPSDYDEQTQQDFICLLYTSDAADD